MGSTGTHREPGMTDRAFFENEFPTMLGKQGRILACASKPASGNWNRVFYAAVRNNDDASYAPGQTWCLVVLMHTSRKQGEWFNFTYKELTDESGPTEDTCPAKILDLLSPTTHQYATEWRNRCRANLARREQSKKVTHGTVIEFPTEFNFGAHGKAKQFRYERSGRRSWFVALDDDGRRRFSCRIPHWRDRSFAIVPA